jgi:hypothetical protein
MAAFLACGLWYWGVQLVLASVPLVLLASGSLQPMGEENSPSVEGWPHFIASSLPFWLSCPVLLALAVETIRSPTKYGHPLEPGFVTLYLLLSGLFGVGFSVISPDVPEWPRDSIYPALALLLAALVVGISSASRWVRRRMIVRHRRAARPSPTGSTTDAGARG